MSVKSLRWHRRGHPEYWRSGKPLGGRGSAPGLVGELTALPGAPPGWEWVVAPKNPTPALGLPSCPRPQ